MASITIRNLEEGLKRRLRMRAAEHGRSMEDEVRNILRASLTDDTRKPKDLFTAIRQRIEPLGGVNLDIRRSGAAREPPGLEE
jgi:plasmid stability protein